MINRQVRVGKINGPDPDRAARRTGPRRLDEREPAPTTPRLARPSAAPGPSPSPPPCGAGCPHAVKDSASRARPATSSLLACRGRRLVSRPAPSTAHRLLALDTTAAGGAPGSERPAGLTAMPALSVDAVLNRRGRHRRARPAHPGRIVRGGRSTADRFREALSGGADMATAPYSDNRFPNATPWPPAPPAGLRNTQRSRTAFVAG
jgi:hypothetical protein